MSHIMKGLRRCDLFWNKVYIFLIFRRCKFLLNISETSVKISFSKLFYLYGKVSCVKPSEPEVHSPEVSVFLMLFAGCEGDHAKDVQVPRCFRKLHHSDLLAAAARVQGSGELFEGEVPQGPEGGSPPGSRKQRGQPRRHCRDLQLHLPQGAGPPRRFARLLPGEPYPGPARHRGPRMPEERQEPEQVGEAELQEAVRRVRVGCRRAQSRDGVELQLQVPLVLRGEVRAVQKDGDQVLLCEERRSEGEE